MAVCSICGLLIEMSTNVRPSSIVRGLTVSSPVTFTFAPTLGMVSVFHTMYVRGKLRPSGSSMVSSAMNAPLVPCGFLTVASVSLISAISFFLPVGRCC